MASLQDSFTILFEMFLCTIHAKKCWWFNQYVLTFFTIEMKTHQSGVVIFFTPKLHHRKINTEKFFCRNEKNIKFSTFHVMCVSISILYYTSIASAIDHTVDSPHWEENTARESCIELYVSALNWGSKGIKKCTLSITLLAAKMMAFLMLLTHWIHFSWSPQQLSLPTDRTQHFTKILLEIRQEIFPKSVTLFDLVSLFLREIAARPSIN